MCNRKDTRMRDMNWTKRKAEIDQAIADVCIQIIKEPLSYFSEADIQQLLVEGLRKIKPLSKPYPTGVPKGKGARSFYKTPLVHREYGGGRGRRIDIVIFDPNDVGKIDNVNLKFGKDYLKPVYAFELGTEKTSDIADHVDNDLTKLSSCTKKNGTGYLIHFYKDGTKAGMGTPEGKKTKEKIENKFKKVFKAKQAEQIPNVKILAILLRTSKNQKKIIGKCEIFNGQEWIKTNVRSKDKLRSAILKELG